MIGTPAKPGAGGDSRNWPAFVTTHWSVVLAAGDRASTGAEEALEKLCQTYWYPLYAFIRRQGHEAHDAEDITQEFFARFLARDYFSRADPALGRFRNFLLASLKHFLSERHRHAHRLKRGGGLHFLSWDNQTAEERYRFEPCDSSHAEESFDRQWAYMLLEKALSRLGDEQSATGKSESFSRLKDFVWGDQIGVSYAEAAEWLGLSEGAFKVMVHRLRKRFRELLREEVAHTVSAVHEIDDELRYLASILRGSG